MNLPGTISGHIIGVSMKEAVRRAIVEVRRQRFMFEAQEKASDYKTKQDFVTSADFATQEIYAKLLREHYPTYGIIAEENNLAEPCREQQHNIWFTIDPLDGTKAYIRRQSHGIGTMISLVCDDEVIAAYIGDIMTEEIYGYRPGSSKVWRISQLEHWEELQIDPKLSLSKQRVLLREGPDAHSPLTQDLVKSQKKGGLFSDMEVSGGSFGIGMARLWPVLGICRKLGFVFLEIQSNGSERFVPFEPVPQKENYRTDFEMLVVHQSRVSEVEKWKV
jgi:hypothetical protein